ncbi:MAG: sulfatase, partial [Chloroflexia bacterium]|nr:sulfatase [Chloroflexia bacterium]
GQMGFPRTYDFMAHLPQAVIEAPDPAHVKAPEMIRVAGEGRFGLFTHAPAQVTFHDVPVYQGGRIEFGLGLHQDAWERAGDGVRFVLEVIDEDGRRQALYERELRPQVRPEDRAWLDQRVDLSSFAGRRLQIIFRTEAGENNQNDWAVWSQPRLFSYELESAAAAERPNVLLISIDTLRGDHVSGNGYARQTTPTLDRLASEGVRFARAYSHSNHTNPSHSTMLTGLYPRSHGVINNRTALPFEVRTIPERLGEAGYHTVGAVSVYHLGPVWNMTQGFAEFYPTGGERRVGRTTTDIALEWLIEQRREPFFMWVHYFDPHAPYLPPAPYSALYSADPAYAPFRLPIDQIHQPDDWLTRYGDWPPPVQDVAEVITQYDGAIQYADYQVSRLLAYLDANGLSDRTIVMVTSDHGEGFGEHGIAYDHFGLHEEVVHVPWVVRAPGRLPLGGTVEDLVSHIDLGPTLLSLLGLPVPADMPGLDLRPLMEGRRGQGQEAVIAEQHDDLSLAVRTREWRLIRHLEDHQVWPLYNLRAGQMELYDLEEDPAEQNNLLPAASRGAEKAREALFEELLDWQVSTPMAEGIEALPLDEETEEMLRRMGY